MEGVPQPYLGDLGSPWLITTYVRPGMILQVPRGGRKLGDHSEVEEVHPTLLDGAQPPPPPSIATLCSQVIVGKIWKMLIQAAHASSSRSAQASLEFKEKNVGLSREDVFFVGIPPPHL